MPDYLSLRRVGTALVGLCGLAVLILAGAMLVGGYFGKQPFALVEPDRAAAAGRGGAGDPPLAVVFWSGDMGAEVGTGERAVRQLAAAGLPVLTVSSPVLFGQARDQAFVDRAVERSLVEALVRTRAQKLVVIGNSFGADILATGLGRLSPALKQRIVSTVLMVPSADIYFHANPAGLFYRGAVSATAAEAAARLRGLPVTCIFGRTESASLCRTSAMAGARQVEIDDGHLMLWSGPQLAAALLHAAAHPPGPMP